MMVGIKILLFLTMVNVVYVESKIKRFTTFAVASMIKGSVKNAIKNLKIEANALYVKSACDTLCKYLFIFFVV